MKTPGEPSPSLKDVFASHPVFIGGAIALTSISLTYSAVNTLVFQPKVDRVESMSADITRLRDEVDRNEPTAQLDRLLNEYRKISSGFDYYDADDAEQGGIRSHWLMIEAKIKELGLQSAYRELIKEERDRIGL